ncbi:MAG: hypothetical protein WBB07_21525, partial [Mycobacterium sp.]
QQRVVKEAADRAAAREVTSAEAQAQARARQEVHQAHADERVELGAAAEKVIDAIADHDDRLLDAESDRAAAKSLRQQAARAEEEIR